jgi:hypothetical protein
MRNLQRSIAAMLVLAGSAHAQQMPTPTSATAATATAKGNPICKEIQPFFWEIGDATGPEVSGSEGGNSSNPPVTSTTSMDVASSAKWLYAAYVVQLRGGASFLTTEDINFLHMTSGYTNLGNNNSPAGTCPSSDVPDTVDVCLTKLNPANGLPYDYQNPATIGFFDYDGGHYENHAGLYTPLGTAPNSNLGAKVGSLIGPNVALSYSQPLIPGAAHMTPAAYGQFLQNIVDGTLGMYEALGTNAVCTIASSTCQALNSPFTWAWEYSMGHWVEDDPTVFDDGAFSSAGGQGFYPWIEASKIYWGLIGRAATGAGQQGLESVQCGQLVRHAWDTGVVQKGRTPTRVRRDATAESNDRG